MDDPLDYEEHPTGDDLLRRLKAQQRRLAGGRTPLRRLDLFSGPFKDNQFRVLIRDSGTKEMVLELTGTADAIVDEFMWWLGGYPKSK